MGNYKCPVHEVRSAVPNLGRSWKQIFVKNLQKFSREAGKFTPRLRLSFQFIHLKKREMSFND